MEFKDMQASSGASFFILTDNVLLSCSVYIRFSPHRQEPLQMATT